MELANLIVQIIVMVVTMIGGGWVFLNHLEARFKQYDVETAKKLDLVTLKMDVFKKELKDNIDFNHDLVHKDFVLQKIHDLEKNHQQERMDSRFNSMLGIFELNFKQLREQLRSITHKGNEGNQPPL